MITLDVFNKLKKKVERAERQRERAAGALEQLLIQLKKEFGCSTIEEAKKKLKELKLVRAQQEKEFAKQLKVFKRSYTDFLKSIEDNTDEVE